MPFKRYRTANNATATPIGAISSSATTVILTTGQGERFPSVYPYLLTIEERQNVSPFAVTKREIVEVTNRVGDTLTISRSAGTCLPNDSSNTPGTTAFSFNNPAQTVVTLAVTAETTADMQAEIATKMPTIGGLGEDYGVNKVKEIDPLTGDEVLRNLTVGTSIDDTELIRSINGTTREVKEVTFAQLKNQLSGSGRYIQKIPVGENISNQNSVIVNILSSNTGQGYTVVANNEFSATFPGWKAFDADNATGWRVNGATTSGAGILEITFPSNWIVTTVDIASYASPEQFNSGWKIQGYNGTSWIDVYTSASATTTTITTHSFVNSTAYQKYRFNGTGSAAYNPGLTTLQFYGYKTVGADFVSAISIVSGAIVYSNTLGGNISGNRINTGIRFSVPYDTTLGVVKTSQVSTSGAARIQLLDDTGSLIAEQTPSIGGDTVTFPNTTISANTVYRLVMNDNANFGNNSNELALLSYQAGFQFTISGTLNGNNSVLPQNIKEVQLGTLKGVKATSSSTAEYAQVSGYLSGVRTKGDLIELSANDGTLYGSFVGLMPGSKYYLGSIPGSIQPYPGTINRAVGLAVSDTELYLSSLYYPGTTITKP